MKKEVLFDPFPKQMEFLEAVFSGEFTVIMYGGAIRGGKTFAGLGALILLCKMYPKSRWAVVRKNLQIIKTNTLPSWNKIKPNNFIKSYHQQTQTVTFTNDSQIIFWGENYDEDKELDRWRGLEVNGFLLEETEIKQQTFYKAIERAGTNLIPNMPKPLIICTCNPSSGYVKELFYNRHKNGTLPNKWKYIQSRIFDNPYIYENKDFMDNLRFMPRYEYELFVEGNWDIQKRTGAEFYKEFNLDKHVTKVPYNPELSVWISIDENVNPFFPASLWQFDGQKAYCFDEIAMRNPNNTTRAFGAEIDRRLKALGHKAGVYITGDATSKKEDVKLEKGMNLFKLVQNELAAWQPVIRISKSNPSVLARQQFINTVFYNQVRGEPYKGIEIFIDEKCNHTKEDVLNVKEDPREGKNGKYKETEQDSETLITSQKRGHHSDCLDYAICYIYSAEYAEFQRGGLAHQIRTGMNPESKHGY